MKIYRGTRTSGRVNVTVDGNPLNPRHDLYNHSPDGFEWGYGGSGPSQLALAILADCLGRNNPSVRIYHEFKWKVIANLPDQEWTLTEKEIKDTLDKIMGDSKELNES